MKMPQGGTFKAVELPQPQTTSARCFGIIDIGTVDNTYPGKEAKRDRKIAILWELPNLKAVFSDEKGEEPFMIMSEMKLSGHVDSNFAKLIAAWRNKPLTPEEKVDFPLEKMLNQKGLLSFLVNPKKNYTGSSTAITNETSSMKLNTITSLPAEMKAGMPEMINKPILWLWDDYLTGGKPFDPEQFKKVFRYIRKKMYTSDEFRACPGAVNVDDENAQPQQDTAPAAAPPVAKEDPVGDDW